MRRYWVPEQNFKDQQVELTGDLFQHICDVCRRKTGDRFEAICNGQAYLVELSEVKKRKALAVIVEKRKIKILKKPFIHLALALPKFQTLEKVLEKSVELGVKGFHPFYSDFSFMKSDSGKMENKTKRWRKIITGATQQTGRGELMELEKIKSLESLLEEKGGGKGFFGLLAYEGDDFFPSKKESQRNKPRKTENSNPFSLKKTLNQIPVGIEEIWIFVGSEGGFSGKDLKLFKNYNILTINLGDQILRVETACVTLLGVLKYHLDQFQ